MSFVFDVQCYKVLCGSKQTFPRRGRIFLFDFGEILYSWLSLDPFCNHFWVVLVRFLDLQNEDHMVSDSFLLLICGAESLVQKTMGSSKAA